MIVDTSVIVALALAEPEAPIFVRAIDDAGTCHISAGTWLELTAVAVRGKLFSFEWLARIQQEYALVLRPVTTEQAEIGQRAYREFGLGSGHPARLNFGDCFAYALAKETGEPLLFKGEDFIHTDVLRAI